jgi:hypothetical protein
LAKVVFYGHEKNRDTAKLAIMNLAVHGLEGKIAAETLTYYDDPYSLVGKCDFVMANPPFNVDLVDAERIKDRPPPPVRPSRHQQGHREEGHRQEAQRYRLQRQLPLDLVLLELPERTRPRRVRDVLVGIERGARRAGRPPQARRDRRRRRHDLDPVELLLPPHRALRALAFRPRQATSPA